MASRDDGRSTFGAGRWPHVAVVTWADPGGMASSVARGFDEIGVPCTIVHYPAITAPSVSGRAGGAVGDIARATLRPLNEALFIRELRRVGPDLVIFIKCDDIHWSVYRALKKLVGARLVAFHPDDPFNIGRRIIKRRGGPSHPRSMTQLREADVSLTWSHDLVRRVRDAGAREVHYLPFACDPILHPRPDDADIPESARSEVVFVGSWDPEREHWLGPVATMGLDFALWGPSWDVRCKDPALKAAWRGGRLLGTEMAQAVAGGAINLNILRAQNKNACNMRTFEIPCAGGFLLHERSAETAAIFPPGEACDDFGSFDELKEKIRYYLDHPDERRRVREEGFAVARRHTYAWWARRALELTIGVAPPAPEG